MTITAPRFAPLPLGAIRPTGWLRNQLRIQADGLGGHLHEFWPSIRDADWLGGDVQSWERVPYWLDGIVPLAWLLDDAPLMAEARSCVNYILDHQHEDGALGPDQGQDAADLWSGYAIMKALTQYADVTGDARVVPAMRRWFEQLVGRLRMSLKDWAQFRWQDLSLSLYWLWDRTGEDWIPPLLDRVERYGYNWIRHFADLPYKQKCCDEPLRSTAWSLDAHVVNHAQAMKVPAVLQRMRPDEDWECVSRDAVATMDRWHGQATGVFTGDESLAGKMPSQGTELCAVVEYMFSLEVTASVFGAAWVGDRLERIAFNALPATFSPDMWLHQYVQQANQVVCRVSEDRVYTSNGPRTNLFGLEPNFGCCTANMHQGWPKLATHRWTKTTGDDEALAVVVYAPCHVETELNGVPVQVEVETEYPFREDVGITVTPERPGAFTLLLRVPDWAEDATLTVAGEPPVELPTGDYYPLRREWNGPTPLTLRLPMQPRIERRFNDAATIHRGPLVYSLKIGEDWRASLHGEEWLDKWPEAAEHPDHELHPTTPWNYALLLDDENPSASVTFEMRPVGDCPFSPDGAPVVARVTGRRLPGWDIAHNAAAPPPQSPVGPDTSSEPLTLIPYGCTNLRVTEFPVL